MPKRRSVVLRCRGNRRKRRRFVIVIIIVIIYFLHDFVLYFFISVAVLLFPGVDGVRLDGTFVIV